MEEQPADQFPGARYRGLLNPARCTDQQRVMQALLAECRAQLTELDRADASGAVAERAALIGRSHELQNGLAYLQSLTELSQVVAALVHEVSEPLTAIGTYASGCRLVAASGDRDRLEAGLQQIAGQAERAWHIIQRLRTFVA